MLSTVPARCRSALDNEFRTGEMLFRGPAPPCGAGIDASDENGGAHWRHRRTEACDGLGVDTPSTPPDRFFGAAEGRLRNAFSLTMPLSCTGVTSTLPVVVTKDIVAGVVAVPHGWATTAPVAGRWPTAQAGTSIA